MWKTLTSAVTKNSTHVTIPWLRGIHQLAAQQLPGRSLVRVSGPDAAPFLQGLMTNDINHLTDESSKEGIMFCMFLNTQGRILYDALIYSAGLNDFLIESDVGGQLASHLTRYRIRRKVSISPLEESWRVLVLSDPSGVERTDERMILARDPRVKELGWRLILPPDVPIDPKTLRMESTDAYIDLKYRLGVGEGASDLRPANSFPLECNCDYLHGVSFHKGCYLGQELTARTHHTGVVRKRLMPVIIPPDSSIKPDDVVTNENGQNVGKIRSVLPGSCHALGLLRVQPALSATRLIVGSHVVTTHRPSWWPIEAPKEL